MDKKRSLPSLSKKDKAILKAVGGRIREIRERKNLSVYDLTGEDMPIKSRQHWQRIENGVKNISLVTIFKIAESLSVEVGELLKNIESR